MKNVVIVSSSSGDWEGLYIDGELALENHRLQVSEVLSALDIMLYEKEVEDGWLEERGRLPKLLRDVTFREGLQRR